MVGRPPPSCRHFLVAGRVQGVYYRASACDVARRLGLTGWVRNTADGRVEAVACGESQKLDAFEQWLWEGPPSARVEQVVVAPMAVQAFKDFVVR